MKSVIKEISLLSILFSLALSSFPLYFRTDNLFLEVFINQDTSLVFLSCFVIGAFLTILAMRITRARPLPLKVVLVAGVVSIALGQIINVLLIVGVVQGQIPSILIGLLVGFGFMLFAYQWCQYLTVCSLWGVLFNASATLLLSSFISILLSRLEYPLLLCAQMGVLPLFSVAGLLLFFHKRGAHRWSDVRFARYKDYGGVQGRGFGQLGSLTGGRNVFAFAWAGFFGMAFNFFTMGLKFRPESAWITGEGISPVRPLAYLLLLILLIVLFVASGPAWQRKPVYYYRILLPVGAAIVLVTPFLGNLINFEQIPLLSWVPFFGSALLFLLGLVVFIWTVQNSDKGYFWLFLVMAIGCSVSLIGGVLAYHYLGEQSQLASLGVLALYFTLMVFSANRDRYYGSDKSVLSKLPTPPRTTGAPQAQGLVGATQSIAGAPGLAAQDACRIVSQEFCLSPREEEVLEYLARGHGARYIGDKLFISSETVRTHTKRIYEKTGVHTKEELLEFIESH